MDSVTSYKPPLRAASSRQEHWPVFVCQQGIFLLDPKAYFPVDPDEALVKYAAGVDANPPYGRVVLPACRSRDALLKQPPLGICLSQEEAAALIADTVGTSNSAAATDIGPIGQDKISNQDFALAATIRIPGRDGTTAIYQFTAVADGVTTRTLWPERSARLAVLGAWRVARRHVAAGRGFSHEAFEIFRKELGRVIHEALERDMAMVAGVDDNLVPPGWAAETYRQFQRRRELWYNSTLLVALVGADGGFVATCGDGGAVVRKTENGETKSTVLVHSTDDLSVSGIVSLDRDALRFQQTHITVGPDTRLEIIMATDGVDRSFRRAAGIDQADFDPYGAKFSNLPNSAALKSQMEMKLAEIPGREIDNISATVMYWPVTSIAALDDVKFRGEIAAAGETVDDVNNRARLLLQAGAMKVKSFTAPVLTASAGTTLHETPRFDDRRLSPPAELQQKIVKSSMARPIGQSPPRRLAPAQIVPETAKTKNAILKSIGFAHDYCSVSPHDHDWEPTVEAILNASLKNLGARDKSIYAFPNLCKLMFYMLTSHYLPISEPQLRNDMVLEAHVDNAILEECGTMPHVRRRDIDLSLCGRAGAEVASWLRANKKFSADQLRMLFLGLTANDHGARNR